MKDDTVVSVVLLLFGRGKMNTSAWSVFTIRPRVSGDDFNLKLLTSPNIYNTSYTYKRVIIIIITNTMPAISSRLCTDTQQKHPSTMAVYSYFFCLKDDPFGLLSPYSFYGREVPVNTKFADSYIPLRDEKKRYKCTAMLWM